MTIFDCVQVSGEYGTSATRYSGFYSWYSNGSASANFTMWQQLDRTDDLCNETIQFSFCFYPMSSTQNATAKIYYTTLTGSQWVVGTPINGTVNQWNLASVNATIPLDAVTVQLWIQGQTNFKAYIDEAKFIGG